MSGWVIGIPLLCVMGLVLLHLGLARTFKNLCDDRYVILHYLIMPFLIFMGLMGFKFFDLCTFEEGVLGGLLTLALCASWTASFPAIYSASPTLVISYLLARTQTPYTIEGITECVSIGGNSRERIQEALDTGLIYKTGNQYALQKSGLFLSSFFMKFRQFLGLKGSGL